MKKIIECAEFLQNQTNEKAKIDESMFSFNNLPIIVLAVVWALSIAYLFLV